MLLNKTIGPGKKSKVNRHSAYLCTFISESKVESLISFEDIFSREISKNDIKLQKCGKPSVENNMRVAHG